MTQFNNDQLSLFLSRNMNNFCSGEHVGTHIDAPIHRKVDPPKQLTLEQISLEDLFGPAVKIDVKEKAMKQKDRNYVISVEDLEEFEAKHGAIPMGAMVFSCTGWADYYGVSEIDYWGTTNRALGGGWNFPSFGKEAAEWLIRERRIKGVAVDVPSCDVGNSAHAEVHQAVLGNNLWCIEHVARSCDLPYIGATVYAFPNKIKGGSGAPVRVVATWPRDGTSAAQHGPMASSLVAMATALMASKIKNF